MQENLSPEALADLMRYGNEEEKVIAAENEDTPREALLYAAQDINESPKVLDSLSTSSCEDVRKAVAANPSTNPRTADLLDMELYGEIIAGTRSMLRQTQSNLNDFQDILGRLHEPNLSDRLDTMMSKFDELKDLEESGQPVRGMDVVIDQVQGFMQSNSILHENGWKIVDKDRGVIPVDESPYQARLAHLVDMLIKNENLVIDTSMDSMIKESLDRVASEISGGSEPLHFKDAMVILHDSVQKNENLAEQAIQQLQESMETYPEEVPEGFEQYVKDTEEWPVKPTAAAIYISAGYERMQEDKENQQEQEQKKNKNISKDHNILR